jgi:hypothetical protein
LLFVQWGVLSGLVFSLFGYVHRFLLFMTGAPLAIVYALLLRFLF